MLNWTSFRAFERGYVAEAPIRDIPRVGSAYKPKGYSIHPPNPLSILLVFCRNNRYRCPYLSESQSTTAVRTTSNIGAGPVVPPTRAVTDKVNRLLTLSRVCSEELDFRTTGYPSATNSTRPAAHRWNTPDPSFAKILCAGTVGSADFLPFRTPVDLYPRMATQSQQQVEYKGFPSIAHT